MIIQCKSCSRKFAVRDSDIPNEGRMVQCGYCSVTWHQKPTLASDSKSEKTDQIKIEIYDEVENGAVVPVKVKTDLKMVKSITIFADKNPNPLIANFDLTSACIGFVSTRIKVSEPSNVIIIVNANDVLYMAKKFVIVHENGCG